MISEQNEIFTLSLVWQALCVFYPELSLLGWLVAPLHWTGFLSVPVRRRSGLPSARWPSVWWTEAAQQHLLRPQSA